MVYLSVHENNISLLVQAQKDMYGKNYDYWISDDMIYSLAKEYHV
jgi:hypothetical protein